MGYPQSSILTHPSKEESSFTVGSTPVEKVLVFSSEEKRQWYFANKDKDKKKTNMCCFSIL